MELHLRRVDATDERTIGTLAVEGSFFCYTLEDPVRLDGPKVPGKTAIPAGRYRVRVRMSPKRGYHVPWIDDVPGFTAIQIHIANFAWDVEGCIGVGMRREQNAIYESARAFHALFPRIAEADARPEGCWITITNDALVAAGME